MQHRSWENSLEKHLNVENLNMGSDNVIAFTGNIEEENLASATAVQSVSTVRSCSSQLAEFIRKCSLAWHCNHRADRMK